MARIQDFILTQEAEAPEIIEKPKKKSLIEYEVLVQNDTDFIIERKTKRTSKILAVIPSQGQYYIKENETCTTIEGEPQLKEFLKDVDDDGIELSDVIWMNTKLERGKQFAENLWNFIQNYIDPARKGLISFNGCRVWRTGTLVDMYEKSPNLALYLAKKKKEVPAASAIQITRYSSFQPYAYGAFEADSIGYLLDFEFLFGLDNVKKYVERMIERDMNFAASEYNFRAFMNKALLTEEQRPMGQDGRRDAEIKELKVNNNTEHFDPASMISYLEDYQRQGFKTLDEFFLSWGDDLAMQKMVYGKIKEKYPENLSTHHDQMALKQAYAQAIIDAQKFADYFERNKHLKWRDDDYKIVVPETPGDIVEEAQQQGNCLRSYIGRIADGNTNVVFLRKKADPDKSYITIEVSNDGRIVQVKGLHNRNATDKEWEIINKWAKARELTH